MQPANPTEDKIRQLITYLKEAKSKKWTIDAGSLIQQFNLDNDTVRKYINHIYL